MVSIKKQLKALLVLLNISILVFGCTYVYGLVSPNTIYYKKNKDKNAPKFNPTDIGTNSPDKMSPVVHLVNKENDSFCTAFVVDNNYAITAAHCLVGQADDLKVQSNNKTYETSVKIIGYNARVDYGLLRGDFKQFNKLQIKPNLPFSMASEKRILILAGYPEGQKGLIIELALSLGVHGFMIEGIGELYPAMSGGPAIDKETGVVIGVNVSVGIEKENYKKIYIAPLTGFLGAMGID